MLSALKKISFIGAGNMASSIIGGLIESGVPAGLIVATDLHEESRNKASQSFGIQTSDDNLAACRGADVLVLAVKPQGLKAVCEEIAPALESHCVVLSIAAGINCDAMQRWLGPAAIVRAMPNTPALVGEGASGYFANELTSSEQKNICQHILQAVGLAIEVEQESHIDSVTAVSGSGPAYFFLMLEAMAEAGGKLGLSSEVAQKLALQTAFGAAKLALNSDVDAAELRRRVTSPNGTTEQAILSFQNNNFAAIVDEAMQACAKRAETLAEELGQ
jgi:pyrroline-5-carboxylate reductase